MNKDEMKKKNRELRMNAPIPDGVEDIRGITFSNIHNLVTMTIVSSWVGDEGVVLWTSDAGDIYSTREIKAHWLRIGELE
jgi:hypothetical protein